jgi:hypothetical protein
MCHISRRKWAATEQRQCGKLVPDYHQRHSCAAHNFLRCGQGTVELHALRWQGCRVQSSVANCESAINSVGVIDASAAICKPL